MPRRNLKNSNIDCKDKETQHSNLRTNQGYQPLHLEAKLGPYDLCFAPLNVSENKMVPMCNTQLDFICHEYGIHNFFIKFRANMATIHVLPLRMNLFQNLKCQTGNSFLL